MVSRRPAQEASRVIEDEQGYLWVDGVPEWELTGQCSDAALPGMVKPIAVNPVAVKPGSKITADQLTRLVAAMRIRPKPSPAPTVCVPRKRPSLRKTQRAHRPKVAENP